MEHFNWTQLLPNVTHETTHVATAIVAGLLLILVSIAGRIALGRGEAAVAPATGFSLKGIIELITEFIVGLTETVIGDEGPKFAPMFATIFFYILINNLIGLVPGMTPATDNINATLAMGLFSFVVYNFYGVREHGISYLKHFMGPIWWLALLMGPIEIISHLMRPMTLGIRLQGNMFADHTVVGVFIELFRGIWFIPVPAVFYGLGIFVSFMQAFVFTMLSMIYISMAIAHDH